MGWGADLAMLHGLQISARLGATRSEALAQPTRNTASKVIKSEFSTGITCSIARERS